MKTLFSDYVTGAGLATDLVNTSPAVRAAGEVLTDASALMEFLTEHGLQPHALAHGTRPTATDVDDMRTLRQEVRTILEATGEEDIVDAATALVARAAIGPSLHRDPEGQWQWYVATSPEASLVDELAVVMGTGLLGVVRTLSRERFRHCSADGCEGMFVDTSKAGRRRYCMPEVCGNRRNVAKYRARRASASAPPS
ncbi:CGNR zinc finger domain-containing protein [Streptomyces sp. AcE210]|uniref:CGNR zinc finger domain-containing protein n=1 Tax=Streptomyces sp. AcE210 TaxID=2292703 RepID=UPI000E306A7B|nr:CGNR zinc finger domain-containing protein [Streptomyces sp. AcE210]RFC78089.1 zf-CGNR multi-domain protein [Streptomyces sp. AcE210]